ncbi:uncharacterized protein LOC21403133 isoform X3 [Morus notabilis]|uniref:uncharacterized protein LOC21403133 isoform X3 n=1 Tax=Morus notabilis TaxID=981085 RepID=UPI000CED430D|nr:uncharacterized protein LOC21403133 isoform X3 [Morus notabilis]
MASILTRIMLPTPPSLYVNYSSLITTAVISFIGLSEAFGSHLGYSKFFNLGSQNQNYRVKLSSRIGMLLLYTPSFLAALASLVLLLPHHKDARFLLLSLALTIHYFKRDFEVLFIHKYSGGMALGSAILISLRTIFYLMGRSYATRKWYLSKFEDFPKEVKALVPFVF